MQTEEQLKRQMVLMSRELAERQAKMRILAESLARFACLESSSTCNDKKTVETVYVEVPANSAVEEALREDNAMLKRIVEESDEKVRMVAEKAQKERQRALIAEGRISEALDKAEYMEREVENLKESMRKFGVPVR
jgi:hypothetical protein